MQLIPRDGQFYELFIEMSQRLSGSARLLNQLFREPGRKAQVVAEIKSLEHEADGLTHEIIERIDRTFVTPFDREDIHALASELDDVVDLLDGTARRMEIFRIDEVNPDAVTLSGVIVRAADEIQTAVSGMKDTKLVNAKARELKKLEEEGDAIYHDAMGRLFNGDRNPLEVIKWKELYDKLEDALDGCEDVANALQSIAIKNN